MANVRILLWGWSGSDQVVGTGGCMDVWMLQHHDLAGLHAEASVPLTADPALDSRIHPEDPVDICETDSGEQLISERDGWEQWVVVKAVETRLLVILVLLVSVRSRSAKGMGTYNSICSHCEAMFYCLEGLVTFLCARCILSGAGSCLMPDSPLRREAADEAVGVCDVLAGLKLDRRRSACDVGGWSRWGCGSGGALEGLALSWWHGAGDCEGGSRWLCLARGSTLQHCGG